MLQRIQATSDFDRFQSSFPSLASVQIKNEQKPTKETQDAQGEVAMPVAGLFRKAGLLHFPDITSPIRVC